MRVFQLQKQPYQLARLANNTPQLSDAAQERLAKLDAVKALRDKGLTVPEAVKPVGISKATYYRWCGLASATPAALEPQSTAPRRKRPATARTPELRQAVRDARGRFPQWGRHKIRILLQKEGISASAATIGRILADDFRTGKLPTVLQLRSGRKARRSARRRPHATRMKGKPELTAPGQLVQVDHMAVTVEAGCVVKHFNASCPVSRWCVAEVYSAATATCAAAFLDQLILRAPFAIGGVQVDGGSEFMAQFEQACRTKAIPLFVLPPRSPKLNGSVERCNGSWRYEFWQDKVLPLTVKELRPFVRAFEHHFNHVRPHQALGYLTPNEYLLNRSRAPTSNVS